MNSSARPISRLHPVRAGQSRTSAPGGGAYLARTVALCAAAVTGVASLTLAAPAEAMVGPNESTDWIVETDPVGDEQVQPAKFNKRGKQVNKVAWDSGHADIEQVEYSWDPAVQQGQEDLHLFIVDTVLPDAEQTSNPVGKRTDQSYSVEVWVDGDKMVTLYGAHTVSTTGRVGPVWKDPADANFEQGCQGDRVGEPDQGRVWFIFPMKCFPAGAKSITKIVYTTELLAVSAKNKGRVAVRDSAEIVANIPVRQ